MSASLVRQLIAKDLVLLRPMMIGALVIGGIGVALMPFGELPFFVGWLVILIAILLLGIFTTAVGVLTERKDRVHLLVLTLPVSPAQYLQAKLAASAIAFFVPWAALLAVHAHNLRSDAKIETVAFPALGTGFGGVPFDEAARQMAAAWRHYREPPHRRLDWDFVVERNLAICYDGGKKVVRD